MTRRVVITGMGALSALGEGADTMFTRLCAGESGIRDLERFDEPAFKVKRGGDVIEVAHTLRDRDEVLARRAIDAALEEAGEQASACALFWAGGLDTFQNTASTKNNTDETDRSDTHTHVSAGACFSAIAKGHARPRRMFAVACASGSQTIGEAFHAIRNGRIDRAVAGGSSVMLSPFYLIGFSALGAISPDDCRPFDAERSGFALADGAAAVVLESMESAEKRGATMLAEVVGFGTSQDAFDLNRPPEDGRGALLCMQRTLKDAKRNVAEIDVVNTHGTGTYIGDIAETAALGSLLGARSADVPVHSAKGAIGHAMAAAGALEAIISVKTLLTGVIPPTVNLRNPDPSCPGRHVVGDAIKTNPSLALTDSFGMGGQNAALLIARVPE